MSRVCYDSDWRYGGSDERELVLAPGLATERCTHERHNIATEKAVLAEGFLILPVHA